MAQLPALDKKKTQYTYIAWPRNIHAKNHDNRLRRLVVITRQTGEMLNALPKTETLLRSIN